MNRTEAATYVGERYGEYLTAVERAATDGVGKTLKPAIDDALRVLGYSEAALPTVTTTVDSEEETDFRVQVIYRAMAQITRDLATSINLSSDLGSLSLDQIRKNAEKDLESAKAAVLERFGTIGLVPSGDDAGIVSLRLNILQPSLDDLALVYD